LEQAVYRFVLEFERYMFDDLLNDAIANWKVLETPAA
jgi:hypothetical protein